MDARTPILAIASTAMAIHAGSSFMTVGLPPGSSFSGSQRISPARDWKRPRFVLTPEWPDLDTCTQKHLGRPKTRELARFWRSRRGVQARLRASRMISTTIAVEPTRKSAEQGAYRISANRISISTKATMTTTTHWPPFDRTVVFGSVIMKKMKSWYIGPGIGAPAASHGVPVTALRTNENAKNAIT